MARRENSSHSVCLILLRWEARRQNVDRAENPEPEKSNATCDWDYCQANMWTRPRKSTENVHISFTHNLENGTAHTNLAELAWHFVVKKKNTPTLRQNTYLDSNMSKYNGRGKVNVRQKYLCDDKLRLRTSGWNERKRDENLLFIESKSSLSLFNDDILLLAAAPPSHVTWRTHFPLLHQRELFFQAFSFLQFSSDSRLFMLIHRQLAQRERERKAHKRKQPTWLSFILWQHRLYNTTRQRRLLLLWVERKSSQQKLHETLMMNVKQPSWVESL